MNFFEYLFCRLYWWNTEVIKERSTPVFRSIVGLAVFHGFSAIPIFGVLYVLIYNSYYIDKTFLGIVYSGPISTTNSGSNGASIPDETEPLFLN